MAFVPFMQAVPAPPEPPTMPTQPMPSATLLLRYLVYLQVTGRSMFPPLEAHLQRYARESRLRQARETAQLRAAAAEAERQPSVADATTDILTPGRSASARPEAVPDPRSPAAQATVPPLSGLEPPSAGDVGNDEPRARPPLPPTAVHPVPPSPRRRSKALTRRLAVLPGGGSATRVDPSVQAAADTATDAPTDVPTDAAPQKAADQAKPTPMALAREASVPPPSLSARRDPRLELLLRFSEEAQRGGRLDPPALRRRLTACVQARELDRGNSREALERMKRRSHALLDRIRSPLGDAAALVNTHGWTRESGWDHLHRLRQLRALLEDGFRCYGLGLDRPLRRMLARQLRRAADQERRLERTLRREQRPAALDSQLEALADTLETVLDQWLPQASASLLSQGIVVGSEGEPASAPEPLEPPAERLEPANTIRPAVVVPLCGEGA